VKEKYQIQFVPLFIVEKTMHGRTKTKVSILIIHKQMRSHTHKKWRADSSNGFQAAVGLALLWRTEEAAYYVLSQLGSQDNDERCVWARAVSTRAFTHEQWGCSACIHPSTSAAPSNRAIACRSICMYFLRPRKNQFLGSVPVKFFKVWLTL